jgi:hypothetical protein
MRTDTYRPKVRARFWLAPALLLAAAVTGATESVGTQPVGTELVSRSTESISGARPHALAARPRIGRIFFSPAERARHRDGLAATPMSAASSGSGPARPERRIVNGALSSGTQGRAVWVNGAAVEDSARDKSAWADRNGNVWLMNGTEGTHLVKPGQSIDRNGVIEDLLPPGAVARR